MTKKMALLVGLTAIDKGIREIRGVVENLNERVQTAAVSIINHDLNGGKNGEPTGDCSRALQLVQALPNSFRREFLIQFFSYFGNIGIDVRNGKVRHHQEGSRRYRKPDLEAAQAHNWYEPFDASGKRAEWYQGPNPATFESNTIGDLGLNIVNAAERFVKQFDATRDNGMGQEVPVYALSKDERELAMTVMNGLKRLGSTLAAREEKARLEATITDLDTYIQGGDELLKTVAEATKNEDEDEATIAEAVAG